MYEITPQKKVTLFPCVFPYGSESRSGPGLPLVLNGNSLALEPVHTMYDIKTESRTPSYLLVLHPTSNILSFEDLPVSLPKDFLLHGLNPNLPINPTSTVYVRTSLSPLTSTLSSVPGQTGIPSHVTYLPTRPLSTPFI